MDGERPQIPPWCPEEYAILMEQCWAPDQDRRPFFPEVLDLLATCEDKGQDLVLPLPPPEDSFSHSSAPSREERGYPATSRERSLKEAEAIAITREKPTPAWQRRNQDKDKNKEGSDS